MPFWIYRWMPRWLQVIAALNVCAMGAAMIGSGATVLHSGWLVGGVMLLALGISALLGTDAFGRAEQASPLVQCLAAAVLTAGLMTAFCIALILGFWIVAIATVIFIISIFASD